MERAGTWASLSRREKMGYVSAPVLDLRVVGAREGTPDLGTYRKYWL